MTATLLAQSPTVSETTSTASSPWVKPVTKNVLSRCESARWRAASRRTTGRRTWRIGG